MGEIALVRNMAISKLGWRLLLDDNPWRAFRREITHQARGVENGLDGARPFRERVEQSADHVVEGMSGFGIRWRCPRNPKGGGPGVIPLKPIFYGSDDLLPNFGVTRLADLVRKAYDRECRHV